MKRLITICAVVVLILSTTGASLAAIVDTPPDAPGWWNSEAGEYYAYGWWQVDLEFEGGDVSPPDDADHWASNFLSNTDFTAEWGSVDGNTVTIYLDNEPNENLYKQIYIYLQGTTTSEEGVVSSVFDTDELAEPVAYSYSLETGNWWFKVSGEIHPQPSYAYLEITVPGLTGVTDVWAGEICLPEPATVALLGLGSLVLFRRKEKGK